MRHLTAAVRIANLVVVAGCLVLSGCEEIGRQTQPDPPKPLECGVPGARCELCTVKSYQSIEPRLDYNQEDKRRELWEGYRLVLQSKAHGRLTLSCGQFALADGSTFCGQGVIRPNDKLWAKEGASGESLWVWTNQHLEKGLSYSLWVVLKREAE